MVFSDFLPGQPFRKPISACNAGVVPTGQEAGCVPYRRDEAVLVAGRN